MVVALRANIRGIPAIRFCRIVMFMWSFGALSLSCFGVLVVWATMKSTESRAALRMDAGFYTAYIYIYVDYMILFSRPPINLIAADGLQELRRQEGPSYLSGFLPLGGSNKA